MFELDALDAIKPHSPSLCGDGMLVVLKQPSRYRGASTARDFSIPIEALSVLASVCAHEGNTANTMHTNAR